MTTKFCLLCAAFSVTVSSAQTSRPEHSVDGLPTPETIFVERLRSLPKSFPPEMTPSSQTNGRKALKPSRMYLYPSPDGKSLSVKPWQSGLPGIRLVPPFKAPPGSEKPAK